jgi:hypothetical protein
MIIEGLFALSASYVSVYLAKFFIEKNEAENTLETVTPPIEKFLEMSVETTKYDPPVYMTSGGLSFVGVGIPFGGGAYGEMKTVLSAAVPEKGAESGPILNWEFTDLDHTRVATSRFWLNTPDDLSNYFKTQGIPTSVARLALPLHVREIKLPAGTTTYKVSSTYTMGSNAKLVARTAALARNIRPLPFRLAAGVAVGTGAYLHFS